MKTVFYYQEDALQAELRMHELTRAECTIVAPVNGEVITSDSAIRQLLSRRGGAQNLALKTWCPGKPPARRSPADESA